VRTDVQRVAVVTGASSGIGEATARELVRRGWHDVLLARREELLRSLADELGGEWELCDVGDREAVDRVAATVLERHPRISLLVNNAGVPGRGRFTEVDPETIERVLRVNYLGGIWCLRAFLPGLQAHGDAHVVNVVSVAGTISFAPAGPYSASKHAQLAFSRSTAAALAGSGIRVHSVLPGFVETEGFPQRAVLRSWLLRRFVIEAPRVAEAIADAVDKDKREVTVPWFPYRFVSIAQVLVPGLVARFIGMSRHRDES
jgi:NAD(P)-dependent dehydrogenase (short-subunit alcohol dehydrogenase family)